MGDRIGLELESKFPRIGGSCRGRVNSLSPLHFSNAAGAMATTTTRLATIKADATPVTMMMEPREAGNLPRIT
jgi:hypothetical protein